MLQNWHSLMPFTTSCVLRPARPINPNWARQPTISLRFVDDFDTVKKEQADTSIWKVKAHLQEAKERATAVVSHLRSNTPTCDLPSSVRQGHPTRTPRPVPTSSGCPCHNKPRSRLSSLANGGTHRSCRNRTPSPGSRPSGTPPTGTTSEPTSRLHCPHGVQSNQLSGPSPSPICVHSLSLQTLSANWHPVRLRLPPVCQSSGFCIYHCPTRWLSRCNAP